MALGPKMALLMGACTRLGSILPAMRMNNSISSSNTCDKAEKGFVEKESLPLPPKTLQETEAEAWIAEARNTSIIINICLGLIGLLVVTACSHAVAGKPTTLALKVVAAATCVMAGQIALGVCTTIWELRHFAKRFTLVSIGVTFISYCLAFVVHYELKTLPWSIKQASNNQLMVILQYSLLLCVPFIVVAMIAFIMMPSEHGTATAKATAKTEEGGAHWFAPVAVFVLGSSALMALTLVLTRVDIVYLFVAGIAILCYAMLILTFALVSSFGGPTNPLPFVILDLANVLSVLGPSIFLLLTIYVQ